MSKIFLPLSYQSIKKQIMKVNFGMMITDGSGKLGGQVASKNRGGAYLRTKVKPSNPQTVAQQQARYKLTSSSKNWSSLSQTEIAAWNSATSSWIHSNVFGNKVTPTGKNLYTKLNVLLGNIGVAPITLPPVPASLSDIQGLSIATATISALTIAWTSGAVPAAENWLLEATKCVNAGRFFVKNLYRVIANIAPAATTPYNAFTAYETKFGAPVAGQRLSIRIKQIDNTTGTPGVPVSAQTIVT
jgi:hypothetical protein